MPRNVRRRCLGRGDDLGHPKSVITKIKMMYEMIFPILW